MHSRSYHALLLFTAMASAVLISGCLFADELVSIDIFGSDEIPANVTKPDGMRIRVNNDSDQDFENMTVQITVPENVIFKAKDLSVDKGIDWVYRLTRSLKAGAVGEYSFTYQPVVYEAQLGDDNEWAFDIKIQVFDQEGVSLGNQSTTWRVTRPI